MKIIKKITLCTCLSIGFLFGAEDAPFGEFDIPEIPEDFALDAELEKKVTAELEQSISPVAEEPDELEIPEEPILDFAVPAEEPIFPEVIPETIPQESKPKEDIGAETVELPESEIGTQGNWIKKNKWLKDANEKNDEIQRIALDVQNASGSFYEKFKSIDDIQDDFYRKSGFDRGEIEELFKSVKKYVEKQKQKDMDALASGYRVLIDGKKGKVDIYTVEEEYRAQIKDVEQLGLDMKSIKELDESVGKRREKLQQQINTVFDEADKAQKIVSDMWHIIDDRKAQEKFYELSNLREKVHALKQYITGDLIRDFDALIQKIKDQVAKVHEQIAVLEKKGIIIENRAERIAQLIKYKEQKAKEEEIRKQYEVERKEKREARRADRAKEGWISSAKGFASDIWEFATDYFSKKSEIKKESVQEAVSQ